MSLEHLRAGRVNAGRYTLRGQNAASALRVRRKNTRHLTLSTKMLSHGQIGPIYISNPGELVGLEYPRPRYHLVSFPVKKGPLQKTMLKFGEYYGRMLLRREKNSTKGPLAYNSGTP